MRHVINGFLREIETSKPFSLVPYPDRRPVPRTINQRKKTEEFKESKRMKVINNVPLFDGKHFVIVWVSSGELYSATFRYCSKENEFREYNYDLDDFGERDETKWVVQLLSGNPDPERKIIVM